MVTASVTNHLSRNQGKEEAKELYEALGGKDNPDYPLGKLTEKILEIHDKSAGSVSLSSIKNNKQVKLDQTALIGQNPEKAKLHEQLMQDFSILHTHQAGLSLSDSHIGFLSKDIAKIMKDYDLTYKGNLRALDTKDSVKIAQNAHKYIDTASWWQNKLENQVQLKEEAKAKNIQQKAVFNAKYQKEFDLTIRHNTFKLADIAALNPKFDVEKFKSDILALPMHKKVQNPEQDVVKKIDELWLDTYKDHIGSKLDGFDRLKHQTKEADKYLEIIREQKEFSINMSEHHNDLVRFGKLKLNDNRISSLMLFNKENPDFVTTLERDMKHGVSIGLWTEHEAIKRLNEGEKSHSLRITARGMFEQCQNHHVEIIEKDLHSMDKNSFIEKNNMKFTDHKSYLEHHVNHQALKPFLQNTKITQKLDDIYKNEEHRSLQKQHELEQQKTKEHEKTLEKEYTMHGPKF